MWCCWRWLSRISNCARYDSGSDGDDLFLWSKKLRPHSTGQFSMAAVKANDPGQDNIQVETSRWGTFVGVYDGYVNNVASRFTVEKLFPKLIRTVKENPTGDMSEALVSAFVSTDEEFMKVVQQRREQSPLMAATGCGSLVGFIWEGKIYVANTGGSRAVLGRMEDASSFLAGRISALQLSEDDKTSNLYARSKLISQHQDDPGVVIEKNGVWLVKGIVEVTRGIGYAFLKMPGCELPPGNTYTSYQLEKPLERPVITAEPTIRVHTITPADRFIIFGSDTLWAQLPNQRAVDLVSQNPPEGIAKKLVQSAMQRQTGDDDICSVVIFINHEMIQKTRLAPSIQATSFRGFTANETVSAFVFLDED